MVLWTRRVLSCVLAFFGAVLVVSSVASLWVNASIVERDGFSQLSQQLAYDSSLREELVRQAQYQSAESIQRYDMGAVPFEGVIKDNLNNQVRDSITEYSQSQQYIDDWEQVLLKTHELNIVPAENSAHGAPQDLQIFVQPTVDSMSSRVGQRIENIIGFQVPIDVGQQQALGGSDGILVVEGSSTGVLFDILVHSRGYAQTALYPGIFALLFSWRLAKPKRWVLIPAGLGAAITAFMVGWWAEQVVDAVLASPSVEGMGRSVLGRIFEIASADLDRTLNPWFWGGLVVSVVGAALIFGKTSWRSGVRGRSSRVFGGRAHPEQPRVIEN